ncbi:MAG: BON domain-containing protein [Bacteroidetes bacterium]|nr:BON domain-containing protein [Bacteroidota bacterium]HET6245014.1 BON domain-containing protein [Bacteroidia bacterium]
MATTHVKQVIKETIQDQFNWDDRVQAENINIDVADGTVKLSGEVYNYSSRMAAEEDALSVYGVVGVENNLKVRYPETYNVLSDDEIKFAIENNLKFDNRIEHRNINISVNNGIVTINGNVNFFWKKDVVESYCYRIAGVVDVNDKITVTPQGEYSDQDIASDLDRAFRRSGYINADEVKIQVSDGEVTLSGKVPSYVARIRANELAQFTTGVVNVIDKLILR